MKRLAALFFIALLGFTSFAGAIGCQTMGRWTGEGAQEVEEGAEDFKEGYKEGKE
jgi:hypothetical protein